MLKRILDTNKKHNNALPQSSIANLTGSIANQIADVIIDTKLYIKRPKETLISEINWIKKGGIDSFQNASRNGKLMFLLKEAIWKADLELNETDDELIEKVRKGPKAKGMTTIATVGRPLHHLLWIQCGLGTNDCSTG